MDQTALPVTAPNDPDPRWPEGYVAVLRAAGAQEKTIPYCIGWVRRFFARFPGRHRRDLGRAEIETFLAETAAHPGVGNWQAGPAGARLAGAVLREVPRYPAGAAGVCACDRSCASSCPSVVVRRGRAAGTFRKNACWYSEYGHSLYEAVRECQGGRNEGTLNRRNAQPGSGSAECWVMARGAAISS